MKSLQVWKLIDKSLQQNIPVMLLYVLESKGSSPGRQGFFMAVNATNEMEGSIGGGIMEHKFVELAKEKLLEHAALVPGNIRRQIHNKTAKKDQSGMICSGEQTIWINSVQDKDRKAIDKIIASLEQSKNGTLTLTPLGITFDDSMLA